ncbi:MAG: TIM barrel protein [Bryobacteraceae bacterium]
MNRRSVLGLPLLGALPLQSRAVSDTRRIRISLGQWSLHKAMGRRLLSNLDFPRVAREQFGIEGLEFVNFLWEAPTADYVQRVRRAMASTATKAVLIMCDGEGLMAHSVKERRLQAAASHYKWVDVAAELGAQAIRANLSAEKEPKTPAEVDAVVNYSAESFRKLAEYAAPRKVNIVVENHGGVSSDPAAMARIVKAVKLPNFGLLPDFGNFPKDADRYDAIAKLMPYAKAVTFKCVDFKDGRETSMDMDRLMKCVLDSGYRNWVGIEYDGDRLTEYEGIQSAKNYLDRFT